MTPGPAAATQARLTAPSPERGRELGADAQGQVPQELANYPLLCGPAARSSLPCADLWQGNGCEAFGFDCGDAEHAQNGLGELVDDCLVNVIGVTLELP